MSIYTKTRIEEIREMSLFFEEDSKKRGNAYLSLIEGVSSFCIDPFCKMIRDVDQRTQPLFQQFRLAWNAFPENELLPFSEPAGLIAFHSWLSWAILQEPHKNHLSFLPKCQKRRFPNAWSN
jgi:hypothetical protein